MIIETLGSASVEAGEGFESSNFTVDNALAMLVLRDKIYVQPQLAVVREVMSNARDANRENGKAKVPIEVFIDESNPVLIIKDSGIGISPERLKFFTRYGGSTKRDDNTQTGGWGLGCKSPFAVSDQFTVNTVWKDEKGKHQATYLMFINDSNLSALSTLSKKDVPDKTPTGTEIHVPIQQDDVRLFRRYAESISKFWGHPLVKNSVMPILHWQALKPVYPEVVEGYNYCEGEGIVIDGIHYDFDTGKFLEFPTNLKKVASKLVYFFDTGEVDVNPTREDINYQSAKTFDAIYSSVTRAKDEIKAEVLKLIEGFKDAPLLAAMCISRMDGRLKVVASEVMSELDLPSLDAQITIDDLELSGEFKIVSHSNQGDLMHWKSKALSVDMRSCFRSHFKLEDVATEKVALVLQDLSGTKINTYIRGALTQFTTVVLIPVTPEKHLTVDGKPVVVPSNIDKIKDAISKTKGLKDLKLHLLSSFPKTSPPPHLKKRSKAASKEFLRDAKRGMALTKRLVTTKRGGVMTVCRYWNGYSFPESEFLRDREKMKDAPDSGYKYDTDHLPDDLPVYGVLPKCVKYLSDNWITPFEFKKKAYDRKKSQGIEKVMAFEELGFMRSLNLNVDALRVFANKLGPSKLRTFILEVLDTPFVRIRKETDVYYKDKVRVEAYGGDSEVEIKAAELTEDILKTYPLLRASHNLSKSALEKEIILYVRSKRV